MAKRPTKEVDPDEFENELEEGIDEDQDDEDEEEEGEDEEAEEEDEDDFKHPGDSAVEKHHGLKNEMYLRMADEHRALALKYEKLLDQLEYWVDADMSTIHLLIENAQMDSIRLVAPPAFARLEKIIGRKLSLPNPPDTEDEPVSFVLSPGGRRSKDTGVF